MFPGLDLHYADPAQPLTTAREELDDLDHDLSDLSVRNCLQLYVTVSSTVCAGGRQKEKGRTSRISGFASLKEGRSLPGIRSIIVYFIPVAVRQAFSEG